MNYIWDESLPVDYALIQLIQTYNYCFNKFRHLDVGYVTCKTSGVAFAGVESVIRRLSVYSWRRNSAPSRHVSGHKQSEFRSNAFVYDSDTRETVKYVWTPEAARMLFVRSSPEVGEWCGFTINRLFTKKVVHDSRIRYIFIFQISEEGGATDVRTQKRSLNRTSEDADIE